MLAVAGFNIVSGLLIIILEKTQTIGILKALGMKDKEIRKVFVVSAMFFVGRGIVWGNIIGFSIVVLQYFLHIVPLNPEYYYTSFVPVHIDFRLLIVLNLSVFLFSILVMVLPSQMISKILPAKSIKFE
jgi:membrane protein